MKSFLLIGVILVCMFYVDTAPADDGDNSDQAIDCKTLVDSITVDEKGMISSADIISLIGQSRQFGFNTERKMTSLLISKFPKQAALIARIALQYCSHGNRKNIYQHTEKHFSDTEKKSLQTEFALKQNKKETELGEKPPKLQLSYKKPEAQQKKDKAIAEKEKEEKKSEEISDNILYRQNLMANQRTNLLGGSMTAIKMRIEENRASP